MNGLAEEYKIEPIPDIDLIRNERKFSVEIIKIGGGIKCLAKVFTKREALEEYAERVKKQQGVRIFHMGKTETGVSMKMISKSSRWKPAVVSNV